MNADIKIISEDIMTIPNFSNEKNNIEIKDSIKEEIDIKDIEKNVKHNLSTGIYSKFYKDNDYFFNIKKVNEKEYNVEINATDKLKEDMKLKINSCIDKEHILNSKKEEFQKLQNNIIINEGHLEKKIFSLIKMDKGEYELILSDIIKIVLDYENFSKDASLIQERIIKYRDSPLLELCFKIYWQKMYEPFRYILKKYIIFLYNEKCFNIALNSLNKIIKKVVDEIFDFIINKISTNKTFLKHKNEYEKNLKYYREMCYFFPFFRSFDKSRQSNIFNFKEDVNMNFSENTFDNVERFNFYILKRTGLNVTLDFFKERIKLDYVLRSNFKKLLLIYQKYKIFLPEYNQCMLLYD